MRPTPTTVLPVIPSSRGNETDETEPGLSSPLQQKSSRLRKARARIFHAFSLTELYLTAILSFSDMVSDIVMIFRYTTEGKINYALASLVCVGSNLLLQALTARRQNKKLPWYKQLREQAFVWLLLKPAIDLYRYEENRKEKMSNTKFSRQKGRSDEGKIIRMQTEMTVTRVIELVTERWGNRAARSEATR